MLQLLTNSFNDIKFNRLKTYVKIVRVYNLIYSY